ncbi:MAG: NAD(P)-dependent oxidoreductase [Alphaproteobacteria bacterium]|jgi:3-hydroxyisobutyrate dehydrogenase|nr:2-hydroxy-3-oxopropionate reductase [Rhodospirillaceae bacterium]MDP6404845.1 NAD(P)-dependent oxidoreductase [Alphaproteobacteria bacterium]MDP6622307.1 NAD(P)-dependent oxidoreductase [Alphaproteobacteria bacterium]|tara:strand:+ start:1181 stop:2065 length:885 start_codon:yes stop_codon:yes gene_type:complete
MAERQKLAYLGIGIMGSRMARRLLDAGYEVAVWNRSAGKSEALVAAGARAAASPAEAADFADVVFACVTDAYSVRQVVFGENGLASVDGAGKVFVDHSSIRPDACREMAADLREASGWGWIDAPVSGGAMGAEQGTLAIMAGGDQADFDKTVEAVAEMSARYTLMGPSGAGQVTKLVNQVIAGCSFVMIGEAVRLASDAGIDAAKLTECLKGGFADSTLFQILVPRMLAGVDEPFGHVKTVLKDVETALDLGYQSGTTMPMTAAAAQIYRLLEAQGHAFKEPTFLYDFYGGAKD